MKSIIRVGLGLNMVDRTKVEEALETHNLAKLWTHTKKVLTERWPDGDDDPLRGAEAVVQEFHQADRTGQVFRYDRDKKGRPHKYDKLPEHISLAKLRETTDGVFNFLDATWSELEQNLSDMRSD